MQPLADDEKPVERALAEVLREGGYEVDTASDGLEAIAALGACRRHPVASGE